VVIFMPLPFYSRANSHRCTLSRSLDVMDKRIEKLCLCLINPLNRRDLSTCHVV
jgi:hypothetical protein